MKEKLTSSPLRDEVPDSSNIQMPFMTVGDQLLKKPIDLEDINRILKHCPKPATTPLGCITYLRKAYNGRSFTQEDMRLIVDGLIEQHTAWDWAKVPTISVPAVNQSAAGYPLNTQVGVAAMWEELTQHINEVFKTKSSLPIAVACRQKTGETVTEFWKRFKICWTTEAGLPILNNDNLLISTFINNLSSNVCLSVKQGVSSWTSDNIDDFQRHLYEKEAAGCFDIKKSITPTHNYQGQGIPQRKLFNRSKNFQTQQYRRQDRDSENKSRSTCCFNCGEEGHWARDCPYPNDRHRVPRAPFPPIRAPTPQIQRQGEAPRPSFNINWQGQSQSQSQSH